jgi:pimeloyl-ACP methyl ester carboxylesterase
VVPDLPELRRTDVKPDHAAAIARLIAALDRELFDEAIWLGHSGGAHVVLEAALAFPARARRLVLVSAFPNRDQLARLHCDALIIRGALEPFEVPPLPHVRVEVIPGAGHDPHLEAPEAFVTAVRAWL